jgi:glycopeptide antibiotics resistance protein
MFTPMGMALPVLFDKKFNKLWKVATFVIVLVLIVEIIQFITFAGSADIDDLILNTIGAIIGYGIIKINIIRKLLKIDE